MTFLTDRDELAEYIRSYVSCSSLNGTITIEDGMISCNESIVVERKGAFEDGRLRVKFNLVAGKFCVVGDDLVDFSGFPMKAGHIVVSSRSKDLSMVGIADDVKECKLLTVAAAQSGGLGMLMIDNLVQLPDRKGWQGRPRQKLAFEIILRHLNGRDIFACQQELIDNGLEEYATL